ncbi:MAG: thermonuclease family protein [Thermomicrobiales bacterium]
MPQPACRGHEAGQGKPSPCTLRQSSCIPPLYCEAECSGDASAAVAAELLSANRTVYLQQDQTDRDQYDRLLRYVWLLDAGGERILLNERLVAAGAAFAGAYPPGTMYQDRLVTAQQSAMQRGRGLWAACERPSG